MIKDNTDKVLLEVDRLIKQKLQRACLLVERAAKKLCPVKTGTLRRSIISNWYGATGSRSISWAANKKKGIKAGKTEIPPQVEKRGLIGSNIEYAPHVEMGTSKMVAQPYLRPALHGNMARIKRIFNAK